MPSRLAASLLVLLSICALARPAQAELTAEQVRGAIDKGVDYLKSQQDPRGEWIGHDRYPGGVTSLTTLALLNAGVSPQEPFLRKSLDALAGMELDKVYTVSLQTMVLCAAEPKRHQIKIGANVRLLEKWQVKAGPRSGAWSYPGIGDVGGDNSNTQFALLALHEARQIGVAVSRDTWQRSLDYWTRTQNDNGSWGYYEEVGS